MRKRRSSGDRPGSWMRHGAGLPTRALALALLAEGVAALPAAAITGICPDGSVYIVADRAQIPCRDSKEVQAHEVPPLRPEYMPTPYTWQVWGEEHNPNNPYNLIDAARQIRAYEPGKGAPPGAGGAAGAAPGPPPVASAPPPAPAPTEVAPLDLGLSPEELRDLYLIVQLSQERVPATISRESADGRELFQLSVAYSPSFEKRLRDAWASRGGLGNQRVLLFSALPKQSEEFWPNLTFVQGHLTFQPEATNARQLGILQGRLGPVAGGEPVLGYVVLPATMGLDQEFAIYWDDLHTNARFGG